MSSEGCLPCLGLQVWAVEVQETLPGEDLGKDGAFVLCTSSGACEQFKGAEKNRLINQKRAINVKAFILKQKGEGIDTAPWPLLATTVGHPHVVTSARLCALGVHIHRGHRAWGFGTSFWADATQPPTKHTCEG